MGWDSLPFWSLSLNFGADFTPFAFVSLNSKRALHRGDGRSKRGRCWYSQKGLCLEFCRPWAVAPYAAAVNSYSCAQVRIRALPPSPQVCSVDTWYLLEKTLTAAGLDPRLILAKGPLEKYRWLARPKLQRCLGGVSLCAEVSPSSSRDRTSCKARTTQAQTPATATSAFGDSPCFEWGFSVAVRAAMDSWCKLGKTQS